jgi:hypothetical protein
MSYPYYGPARQFKVWGTAPWIAWIDATSETLRVSQSDLIARALEELAHAKGIRLPPDRLERRRRSRPAEAIVTTTTAVTNLSQTVSRDAR